MIPFSIIGILATVGLAFMLGFRKTPRLESGAEALRLVEDALPGFGAREAALDADGRGALVAGAGGKVALVRPIGDRWTVRVANGALAEAESERLRVEIAEPMFPPAELRLGKSAANWAARL
jgi:hypothetical protein